MPDERIKAPKGAFFLPVLKDSVLIKMNLSIERMDLLRLFLKQIHVLRSQ